MKYIEVKVLVSPDCYELHYLPEGSPDIAHWIAQGGVVNESPAAKIKPPVEKKIKDNLPKSPRRMTWKDWAVANGK